MFDRLKKLAAAAPAAAMALASPAVAQDAQAETAETASAPGPALWKVADEDTTIYLFGTVHALPKDIDWYDARISNAFDASDEFVTEIDMAEAAASAQSLQQKAMLPEGTTLRSLMTEEDRAEYEAALTAMSLPVTMLDPVEPWYAAMTLSLLPLLKAGYSPEQGVEMALTGRASEKTHGSLETVDEQVALFDTLPMEAQLTFLDETVEAVPRAASTLDAMLAEWAKGDADALAKLMNDEMDDPVLYKRLLTDRNANWADWIETRMAQPGNVFIAVGAGHLAGKGSVQEQLQAKGIDVTRVE